MDLTFKKSSLQNYNVIPGPGTFIVKNANTIKPEYLYEDGKNSRYIVNLKAAVISGFEECLGIMGSREAILFDEIKHCFLTGALWENSVDDVINLPTKNEEVIATFDYVDDILRCTSITLIPRKKLTTFDLNSFCTSRKLLKNLLTKN